MTFESSECWDCPIPALKLALYVAAGILAFVVAAGLLRRCRGAARVLAWILMLGTAAWYFVISFGVIRWGMRWQGTDWRPAETLLASRLSRTVDVFVLLVWYAITVFLWVRLRRYRAAAA